MPAAQSSSETPFSKLRNFVLELSSLLRVVNWVQLQLGVKNQALAGGPIQEWENTTKGLLQ